MKRILCVTCGILMLASSAVAEETCANGKGIMASDNDGNNYCVSQVLMNWFSAFSWCETAGGRLLTFDDCDCKKCDRPTAGSCRLGGVHNAVKGEALWTSNIADNNSAYAIYNWGDMRKAFPKTSWAYTACKMP